jgi:hypothetical protein
MYIGGRQLIVEIDGMVAGMSWFPENNKIVRKRVQIYGTDRWYCGQNGAKISHNFTPLSHTAGFFDSKTVLLLPDQTPIYNMCVSTYRV